jgi:hypothetical protein
VTPGDRVLCGGHTPPALILLLFAGLVFTPLV